MKKYTIDITFIILNGALALLNLGLFIFGAHSPISISAFLFGAAVTVLLWVTLRWRMQYDRLDERARKMEQR